MPKRLHAAIIYSLTVKNVAFKKSFVQNNLPVNVFNIYLVALNGEEYYAQYLGPTQNQDYFVPGVRVTFKVSKVNQFEDEIIPLMNYVVKAEKELNKEFLKPVNGETYHAAMHFACQIVPTGTENIDDLLTTADRIDAWMINKQAERILGE